MSDTGHDPSGHWVDWHKPYDDPNSPLSRRLAVVQRRLSEALALAPAGPVRLISMCAGQGRDVLGVLPAHPRRHDVTARLVELDEHNSGVARRIAESAGLNQVDVVTGDAALTDVYEGAVPAEVVLACGIFGNITDDDIAKTIAGLPSLCAPSATVIWTRHTKQPDVIDWIQIWFSEAGFENVAFDNPEGTRMGIGTARLIHPPVRFRPGERMFTFVQADPA